MNTTTRNKRFRIPNHLALLAAVMLMATVALAPSGDDRDERDAPGTANKETATQATDMQAAEEVEVSSGPTFRLVLFRHG